MISVRGLSRCLVNDQQRFARFDHYLAAADFLRLRAHVKARSSARQLLSLEPHVGSRDSGRVSLGRLSQYLILMGPFIAPPLVERRHTRQRIAEKPSRQIVRLELSSAVTIRQGQGTGPKAR